MKKYEGLIPSLVEHQLLQIYNGKTDHLRQLFGICYGEMTLVDQEDYHLFHNFLVYTEDLYVKLFQIPFISLRRHHVLLMEDYRQIH